MDNVHSMVDPVYTKFRLGWCFHPLAVKNEIFNLTCHGLGTCTCMHAYCDIALEATTYRHAKTDNRILSRMFAVAFLIHTYRTIPTALYTKSKLQQKWHFCDCCNRVAQK